ncbi:uncharacterized protein LOC129601732 [Paramacrobiotus metropolitanus]|uniref:uncharacterized protein LOC129601732 n=1 Tax=Paramacrobiotus metropolitanus TaxID=2943436 RepID=UPI002445FD6C|nr:uncharacterized protein LOC129601732 [Paramacrobiotus metropolitanus]
MHREQDFRQRGAVTFAALLCILPLLFATKVVADVPNDASVDETAFPDETVVLADSPPIIVTNGNSDDGNSGIPGIPAMGIPAIPANGNSGNVFPEGGNIPQYLRIGKRAAGITSWFSIPPFTRRLPVVVDPSRIRGWRPAGSPLGGFVLNPDATNQRLMSRRASDNDRELANTGNWYLGKRSVDFDDSNNTLQRDEEKVRMKRDSFGGLWILQSQKDKTVGTSHPKRSTPIIWSGTNRYLGKRATKSAPWYLGKRSGINEFPAADYAENDGMSKRGRTGPWYLGRKRGGGGVWYLGK